MASLVGIIIVILGGLILACNGNGNVKKCPRINNPMNGYVTMVRKRPGQPQKAHFHCDPGYMLIPPEWLTLECLERNMRWSNDYPTCRGQATVADIAKGLNDKMDQLGGGSADAGGIQVTVIDRCIVPKKPIFGSIFINHEEKTLKYKCDVGFWLVGGRSERNCMKKQHGAGSYYDWSGHEPYCIAIGRIVKKCPRINNPMNGYVTMERKRPGQPQKAHFHCDPGYNLIPPEWQTLECLERNMRWSNDYPTCRVTVIDRCIVPKKPIFGSIFINHEEKTLKYKCDVGFWLVGGRSERNCMKKQHGAGSYYDWSGHEPYCIAIGRIVKKCPRINNPMNGYVTMERKRPGQPQKANFHCDPGYDLIPPEWQTLECLERNMRWSNDYPTCRGQATVADIAKGLNDKMDQLGGGSADAGGIQGNLRPGMTGLDLVFALDTSSSIGPDSMKKAKKFIKIIIGKFGVSNRADGGSNGTRIALLTFNDKTTIVFNLNDKNVRSVEAAHEAIDALKSDGGGTNFAGLFTAIDLEIYIKLFGQKAQNDSSHVKKRFENANRAIFIITDAKDTSHVNGKDPSMLRVKTIGKKLRVDRDFEIFTIGIGSNIDKKMMADIASRPFYEHVFEIKKFADLNEIGDIISEENIDFGKCGVSGNTEAGQDGDSDPGAWPWIGWITVLQSDGKVITCGGALLCDNWFVTLASCVTETSDNILRPVDGYMINLYMGDHKIDAFEENDWMVAVKNVHVHPNYTGLANDYGVATFDIAMLEIDDDNTTMLKLNKFVRPLCFMESRVNTSYAEGLALMSAYKSLSSKLMGTVAGWGHMGRQKIVKSKNVFPKASLKQTEREVQSDAICRERYPGIDTDQFVCVGNVQSPEFNSCYGDIGGPLMVETDGRRYTFLGLSLNTERCKDLYKFSLFLNVLHPEINTWVQRQMRGCNRVEEPIPYVEEDVDVLEPHDGDDDDGHDAAEVIEDDANRSSDGDESHDANDRGDDDGSEILWEE